MRLHKIYEVGSSTVVYAIQSMPTHYKLSLTKYTPTASRRENPDLKQSLEEMTVSQEDLFGDIISQEVADTVAEVETSLQQTSYVSPQKDFDNSSARIIIIYRMLIMTSELLKNRLSIIQKQYMILNVLGFTGYIHAGLDISPLHRKSRILPCAA